MKTKIMDWVCRVWMFYLVLRYHHWGVSELGLIVAFAILIGARMIAKAIKEKTWLQTW